MDSLPEEQLDPRIQVELEKLNTATDEINKLEAKLEETNNAFSSTFAESTARLKSMGKKLGTCIEKARPYYEALELARTSQLECQRAAVQYQRANALHQAAKETIASAEERFENSRNENWQFDSAWQEMLNHAIMKVMEAEAQKAASEREHMRRAAVFQQAEQRVQQLQRGLKSSINKSLGYFEEKMRVEAQLERQKERAQQLQVAISASKASYAQSLRRLEQISEQIHEQRRCQMPREPGVGAELNSPPAGENQHYESDIAYTQHRDTIKDEKYWESLKEKLENLETEVNDDKLVMMKREETSSHWSEESRERSGTGSSDTPSCSEERFVSGESSSSQGYKSDVESVYDGTPDSPDDDDDDENFTGKLSIGRRTPPGTCEKVVRDELNSSKDTTTVSLRIGEKEDSHSVEVSNPKVMAVDDLGNNTPQSDKRDNDETSTRDEYSLVTNELKVINLGNAAEGIDEGNDCDDIKEDEGDGSISPPPTPCQPSRSLTVIVEELEHCALPE